MGFKLMYWTPMGGSYLLMDSNLEKFGKFGEKTKKSSFPGGYGQIGEIQHGQIWPDWGHRVKLYILEVYFNM